MHLYGQSNETHQEMSVRPWYGRILPFRIFGNTYFIGTYQVSSHLIDTGDGLIMIDTGFMKTAYLMLDSIYRLGFDPQDIKYIINTHWHDDHTEATAAFADLTGAKTLIGREDAEKAAQFFTPDILVDEGDTLTLGNTTIHFLHTPGHTKGTLSFFYNVEENGKTYRVGSFGGAGTITMHRGAFDFEGCREAYQASVDRLKKEKVDVFIGNHSWNNDTYGRSLKVAAGDANAFVGNDIWLSFLEECESTLHKIIEEEDTACGG